MRSKFLPVAIACALLASVNAFAQDYPVANKTITFVLPYAPGGPTDKAARDLAQAMSKAMGGHSIVIDNSAGASGSIGANKVAKAGADGYTLLFTHIAQATLPTFFRNLPYNVEKDFEYIGLVSENPMNLIGRPSLPANNMTELVTWIQANKGKINIANAGPGSASHLCGMLFQSTLKVDMTSVPYKGTAPAMTDLIGGQVTFLFVDLASSRPHVQSGRVRALALSAEQKSALAADLPTVAEQANLPGFDLAAWIGVVGPAGMPPAIVNKLSERLAAMLVRKDVAERLVGLGVEAHPSTAAELDAYMKRQLEGWGRKVKDAGIQPE